MNICTVILIWLAVVATMAASEGSVNDYPHFNAYEDARSLRRTMKGWGTDEDTLTDIIANRSNMQRQEIISAYYYWYERDLVSDFQWDTSGDFEKMLVALMRKPHEYDAECLKLAMEGFGTNEKVLIEILTSRSNSDINGINKVYKPNPSLVQQHYKYYSRKLEGEMENDLSGLLKRLLLGLNNGNRDEGSTVNQSIALSDARKLYRANSEDGDIFKTILVRRNHAQLRSTFHEYQRLTGEKIETKIDRLFSGWSCKTMLAIVQVVRDTPKFFADKLHESLSGSGTQEEDLIRIVVSRSEVDMEEIKERYLQDYDVSLYDAIASDTSGDIRMFLLKVVGH